jgi:tetratricopeptide (TPR) repeat protein
MKRLFLILITVFTLIGAAQAQENVPTAIALNDTGVDEFYAKNYMAAIEKFERSLVLYPGYATARYNLGNAYLKSGDPGKALLNFEKAVELYPRFAAAYNQIGVIYSDKSQYEKAIEAFKKALDLKAPYPLAMFNLGSTYAQAGQFNPAINMLKQAAVLDDGNVEILITLGYALSRQKYYDEAVPHLRRAVEIAPENARAQFFLGALYAATNDKTAALTQYNKLNSMNESLAARLYQSIYSDKVVVINDSMSLKTVAP